jgi:hypothetical protein
VIYIETQNKVLDFTPRNQKLEETEEQVKPKTDSVIHVGKLIGGKTSEVVMSSDEEVTSP